MATISGEFRLAEAGDVSRVLTRRLLGWRRYLPFAWLAAFFASLFALAMLVDTFAPDDVRTAAQLDGSGALLVLALYLWTPWWRSVVFGAWRRRGVPDPLRMTVETSDAALLITIGDVMMRIPWPQVSELSSSRARWVFIANYSAVGVPRRFFADLAAERAFVADALARIPSEARARSADAAAFAAGGPR